MLSAAPARPLWWLARWAARLLTGLAVAAAFTLGAWALPGHPAPTDWPATPAPLAETAVAPASTGLAAPLDLAASLDPAATLDLAAADPTGVSATQPPACGQPGLTVLGSVAAGVTRGSTAPVEGVRAARAPPHA
ncbi:hypothetical protein ACIBQ2_14760 [Micromonospora sediminimaris]|uniref:hypothetical protein n=1 Tax=Micromonospora sediminimaris TaxID=547162 RepID=UPI0037B8CC42